MHRRQILSDSRIQIVPASRICQKDTDYSLQNLLQKNLNEDDHQSHHTWNNYQRLTVSATQIYPELTKIS